MDLIILIVMCISLIDLSNQQQCTSSEINKIDSEVARLVTLGHSGRKFPESKGEDLKTYCNESSILVKQIESFKRRCMKDLPKQITSIMIYAVKNNINLLCKKDSKRLDELLGATPCANKANAQFNKCYTKYIDLILAAKNVDDKIKIPWACCGLEDMLECLYNKGIRVKGCDHSKLEIIQHFLRSIMADAINLVCGEYTSDSDKCDQLGDVPKKRKNQRRTKSFLMPMIDLLSSFPEV